MLNELDFDKTGGLISAVVQDSGDGRVLMLGFMNREAFEKTVETGKVNSGAARATSFGPRADRQGTTLPPSGSRSIVTAIPC